MSWQIEALGGPVLAWEMKRAARRTLWKCLPIAYSVWLLIQALVLFGAIRSTFGESPSHPHLRLVHFRTMHAQLMEFLDSYLLQLLQFQLVLVIAIVPALTASCLGQEKERGTLFALFGTELTSRQILLGKLFGRLLLIAPLVLTTLPALVFMVTLTGRGLTPLILALAQEAVFAFALGAICLLFGIWIRRAADAVIASYLFLGLAYLAIRGVTNTWPHAFWFDPVENLRKMHNSGPWLALMFHLTVWFFLGAFCLRFGWGSLRKVCVDQRDKRPSRRLWAFRPAVGNNPICWRECYVIGLAPIPILRIVPRWLALLGVFTISTTVAGLIANNIAPGFAYALLDLDPVRAFYYLWTRNNAIAESVWLMGLVFIVLADVLLLVRCGTSVAEEKRRNTWDDLLLTAQSFREITNGKMWGILQATIPYLVAYAIPVILFAALGGPGALLTAGMWIILPCAIVFAAALLGIDMLRVPPDMDETRPGGAFWSDNSQVERQQHKAWG